MRPALALREPLGQRNFDSYDQWQFASVDTSSTFTVASKARMTAANCAAKSLAGELDFSRGGFPVPRKQRDVRHLRKVHPNGSLEPAGQAVVEQVRSIAVGSREYLLGQSRR